MKLSHTTLLAILATTSLAASIPQPVVSDTTLVKRSDANEILNILDELNAIKVKRDLVETEEEHLELLKRQDSVIGDLLSGLASSGIIQDVWNTLTTDQELRSEIGDLTKAAIQGLIVRGPALIKALFNSGLIGKIFKDVINDKTLLNGLLGAAKALFTTGLNLLTNRKSGGSTTAAAATTTTAAAAPAAGTTTAAAAAANTAAAAAGGLNPTNTDSAAYASIAAQYKREEGVEYLEKKDLSSLISTVVTEIKNSGIFSSLINKVLADPQASISFLTTVLQKGVVLGEDVYNWAKNNGLLEKGLQWLQTNGGTYAGAVANLVGDLIDSGKVSASDVDNATTAGAATYTTTTAATTATTMVKRVRRNY
ncbi:Opaque-phase-specific protein OP4 [Meyerozyma sp. JA9]|nr:Opaque-phase-specific protein OP4 [Meyerozyma sp. JA9]